MAQLRKDDDLQNLQSPPAAVTEHPLFNGSTTVGMISGENPRFAIPPTLALPGDPTTPRSGHEALGATLKQMGLKAEPRDGRYGAPEKSWLVYGPTREQMYHLGRNFGQESVVFAEGGKPELMYTNGPNAGRHHPYIDHQFFQDEPEDYYTHMPELGGYLRINFDWDQTHPSKLGQNAAIDALNARNGKPVTSITPEDVNKAQALLTTLKKALAVMMPAPLPEHPLAHPWHDGDGKHELHVADPGVILVSRASGLSKAIPANAPAPTTGTEHLQQVPKQAAYTRTPTFREVHPTEFESIISKHPNQSSLTQSRDYTGKRTFLADDNQSGYALTHDGDLQSVFSLVPGAGAHAVNHAIQNGATTLDAFEGKLPQYYSKFGFREARREPNWTPGGPDVVYMTRKAGDEPSHPTNDQVAPVGVSTYAKHALPYGSVDRSSPSDLRHYPYVGHAHEINQLLKDHGFTAYYAGGQYGRPDLANRNYLTKHLMIYDPSPEAGGNSGVEEHTDAWRKVHELAHALTLPDINQLYGEGRRIGKLGTHRTLREALRSVHWEWLAAHKQRELSKQLGIYIPEHEFNKELNTVMHDAIHRAVTGKFTEPVKEGFRPHEYHVPLETALGMVREGAHNLGLTGMHDLIKKSEDNTMADEKTYEPREWRKLLAKALQDRVDAYAQQLLELRKRELAKSAAPVAVESAPAIQLNPLDNCPLCGRQDLPGKCACMNGPLAKSDEPKPGEKRPKRPEPKITCKKCGIAKPRSVSGEHMCNDCFDKQKGIKKGELEKGIVMHDACNCSSPKPSKLKGGPCQNCRKPIASGVEVAGDKSGKPYPKSTDAKKAELSAKAKEPVKPAGGNGLDPKKLKKGDFGASDNGKVSTLPTPPAAAPKIPGRKFGMNDLGAGKAKLQAAGVKPISPLGAPKPVAAAPAPAPGVAGLKPPPVPAAPGPKLPTVAPKIPKVSAAPALPKPAAAAPAAPKTPGVTKSDPATDDLKKNLGSCVLCGKGEHTGQCK